MPQLLFHPQSKELAIGETRAEASLASTVARLLHRAPKGRGPQGRDPQGKGLGGKAPGEKDLPFQGFPRGSLAPWQGSQGARDASANGISGGALAQSALSRGTRGTRETRHSLPPSAQQNLALFCPPRLNRSAQQNLAFFAPRRSPLSPKSMPPVLRMDRGDCKTAACHATRLICGICSSFRSIALSRFCNGGSTAFFNSATVFSRSPTRL